MMAAAEPTFQASAGFYAVDCQVCLGCSKSACTRFLCALQERTVVDVAKDIAKIFNMKDDKITYVKDRAFNDQCALSTAVLLI